MDRRNRKIKSQCKQNPISSANTKEITLVINCVYIKPDEAYAYGDKYKMRCNIIVEVNLEKSYITIDGFSLKYKWNDDIRMHDGGRGIKAFACLDESDPTKIYLMLGSYYTRLDAAGQHAEGMFSLTLQENFWGGHCIKLHRNTQKSRKYNEDQKWVRAVIPINSNISLAKPPKTTKT